MMDNICKDFDEKIPVPGSDADCEESEAEKEYWDEKMEELAKNGEFVSPEEVERDCNAQ